MAGPLRLSDRFATDSELLLEYRAQMGTAGNPAIRRGVTVQPSGSTVAAYASLKRWAHGGDYPVLF
jgi:hypothetical protein